MKTFGIKFKLIVIFTVIKILPLLVITYIAIIGANKLSIYFNLSTKTLFTQNKEILKTTTSLAINDAIKELDKKSQHSLEKLSVSVATQVADFLYERDKDLLFLSRISLKKDGQRILNSFYQIKKRAIYTHEKYIYDGKKQKWISSIKDRQTHKRSIVISKDNKREFHYVDPKSLNMKNIPIYKEVSFFNTKGQEIYKKSSIEALKMDISKKENTYCKAETYWNKIQKLKEGEIYVSDVIGAYVPSKIIGTFSKEKASKMGVEFKPELYGYAGIENPNGKRFEGIIRFITPVFKNFKKIGYISLALDHRHIMEFTDTLNPINPQLRQDISNAGSGNYAFMWDYKARNISHPRDYFIMGFDPKTGKRVPGWVSAKVASDFKKSSIQDFGDFLKHYPKFNNQSLSQKPNLEQLKHSGQIGLDCRYLNFAPQCQGWMQLTKNGGYGSFIIYWSKVWKLTTAATIPYYTGQYGKTDRGFGFVTIGANIDEFHKVANKTKKDVEEIIQSQTAKMEKILKTNNSNILNYTNSMINELTFITLIMVIIVIFIAILMSNYITKKIQHLIDGTKMLAEHNLDYQLEVTSEDEIGELEKSFNHMAEEIKEGIELNKEKVLK